MYTHMPFLYPDGMLFAAGEPVSGDGAVRWKLMAGASLADARPLDTGLPASAIACSPALARRPYGFDLIFVGQRDGEYRFFRMTGPDLAHMSPALPTKILDRVGAHAGTASGAFEAVDRPEVAGIVASAFGQSSIIISYHCLGLSAVARIAFEFSRPWRMLVSGRWGEEWHTVVHDFKTGKTSRIRLADGRGVYKASIDGERLAYAERLSEAFEARAIRFAEAGAWSLEPVESPATPVMFFNARAIMASSEPDPIRARRERCLRANCDVGKYCGVCRNHQETRADLAALGIVDRDGNGCPRGLAWDAPAAALATIRRGVSGTPPVWCERFMLGTTPARCQQCLAVRSGSDADAAARWLQHLADGRRTMACASRVKTDARRIQECCGRTEKEIAVYRCAVRDREVEPEDCRGCAERTPPATVTVSTGGDGPC